MHSPLFADTLSNNRPNRQRIDLPSRHASGGGAIAALNGASGIRLPNTLHSSGFFSGFNGISEGSSLHSSVFFSDVGEDAGPLFDVGNEESVGPGALSSGKAASSAGVHAVEVSPSPLPHDMLARQTHSEAKAVFKKKVMKAHFTVKEDLEQIAIDFITKVGARAITERGLHDINTTVEILLFRKTWRSTSKNVVC